MRLDELVGVKKLADKTPGEITNFVRDEFAMGRTKLRPIGKGAHALAFTDGTSVFKFWLKDSAYEKFVQYCLKHQDNPWLPKFKSKIRTLPVFFKLEAAGKEIAGDKVKYIKMELLKDLQIDQSLKLFDDPAIIEELKKAKMLVSSNFLSVDTIFEYHDHIVPDVRQSILNVLDVHKKSSGFEFDYSRYLDKMNPAVFEVVKLVGDLSKLLGDNDNFDLNMGNMMQRGDKQIVIIDPLANEDDFDFNILYTKLRDF